MGWTAYLLGGWGGADALALAVLGFTAPYGVSGITSGYSIDLIVNLLIAGLLVTLVWSVVLAARKPEKVLSQTYENLRNDRARLVLELMGSLMFAFIAQKAGMQGFLYAVFFVSMVLLIRFMRAIESEVFEVEKDIEEVQPGEIVDTEALDGRIRGIEEDELEELKEGDVESVKVKSGIRFVPVFPVALLLTDFTSLGISFIVNIFAFGI
jgi:preprotein translocase subunit YajC